MNEGDLYAVVVGVSKYRNPDIPKLKFADKDAKDFADFLQTQKELFRNIHLTRLINEDATRAKVEEQLFYGLRPAGKNDTVILFFAGHGADDLHAPGEFFFLTYDADSAKPLSSAVNMNRSGFMSRLDSKRVLLIADACHSGGYAVHATRGGEPAFERFKRQVSESEGKIILSASKSNEVSIEKSELGNGVFTHYLLKGLKGEADLDGKGVVTLQNLYSYVYQKTKDETKGLQHPQKDGPEVGLFPLALTRAHQTWAPVATPTKPGEPPILQVTPDYKVRLETEKEQRAQEIARLREVERLKEDNARLERERQEREQEMARLRETERVAALEKERIEREKREAVVTVPTAAPKGKGFVAHAKNPEGVLYQGFGPTPNAAVEMAITKCAQGSVISEGRGCKVMDVKYHVFSSVSEPTSIYREKTVGWEVIKDAKGRCNIRQVAGKTAQNVTGLFTTEAEALKALAEKCPSMGRPIP